MFPNTLHQRLFSYLKELFDIWSSRVYSWTGSVWAENSLYETPNDEAPGTESRLLLLNMWSRTSKRQMQIKPATSTSNTALSWTLHTHTANLLFLFKALYEALGVSVGPSACDGVFVRVRPLSVSTRPSPHVSKHRLNVGPLIICVCTSPTHVCFWKCA